MLWLSVSVTPRPRDRYLPLAGCIRASSVPTQWYYASGYFPLRILHTRTHLKMSKRS